MDYEGDSTTNNQPQAPAQPAPEAPASVARMRAANAANQAAPQQTQQPRPATAGAQQLGAQQSAQPQSQPRTQAYAASSEAYFEPDSTFPSPGAVRYVPVSADAVVAPKPRKSRAWIVAIVVVVCLCALVAFCVNSCSQAVTSLSVTTASAASSPNSVAIIEIDSTIQYDWSANSPEGLKSLLDSAAEDDNVKAVVLRVDSGGGTATAGEEMATYVRQFRETSHKPVVVSSASINCSAAYEISSQADYIFVAKTTEIGAIGTIMQSYDYSELMEKLGIKIDNIASSESKDSTYGTRALTDEERAYYQSMVDEINDAFVQNVATGRNMTLDQARELANGLPYAGTTAIKNGLADEIGTLEDAVAKAGELANVEGTPNSFYLSLEQTTISSLAGILGQSPTINISLADGSTVSKDNANVVQ